MNCENYFLVHIIIITIITIFLKHVLKSVKLLDFGKENRESIFEISKNISKRFQNFINYSTLMCWSCPLYYSTTQNTHLEACERKGVALLWKEKKNQINLYIYINSLHQTTQNTNLKVSARKERKKEKKRKIPHFTEEQYLLIILKVSVRKERIL